MLPPCQFSPYSSNKIVIAAVLIFSVMVSMYWLDGCWGRRNQFYSIGVFCWCWSVVRSCCVWGWWWSVWWWSVVVVAVVSCGFVGWRNRFYNISPPKHSNAIKRVPPAPTSIRPIHKDHTGKD